MLDVGYKGCPCWFFCSQWWEAGEGGSEEEREGRREGGRKEGREGGKKEGREERREGVKKGGRE